MTVPFSVKRTISRKRIFIGKRKVLSSIFLNMSLLYSMKNNDKFRLPLKIDEYKTIYERELQILVSSLPAMTLTMS